MQSSFDESLDKYAKLAIKTGCNLQQGQELYIGADIAAAPLVRMLVDEAYQAGASDVTVHYTDEVVSRMGYANKPVSAFEVFPEWQAMLQNGVAKRGAALLFIDSEDPELFAGIDQRKLAARTKAAHDACKDWRHGMDFGVNVWCIIGGASPAWARRVFPTLPEDEAVARLWDAIFKTVRVDQPDPEEAWRQHDQDFRARIRFLNEAHIDTLHYTNSIGTDITVGLTPKSLWEGGGSATTGGTYFFANMPTEEIFTSPDRLRTQGTVVSSMPLNHNGALIDGFSITFDHGRAVNFSAAKGEDVLREIINTDDGAHYLGEASLVPKESPIHKAGMLFLSTLFDENAACHMALGAGFPECYEGGLDMTPEQLLPLGVNDSATHVDFMLGTDDLDIVATTCDGRQIQIFKDGTWAFEV